MVNIPLFLGFYTSQVVQDFFHQQYDMTQRNSGKTFGALQDLLAAPSGLYMAPLRLLAWEVYEKMRKAP